MAILADIAILEVALRNAMHGALDWQWGPFWYQTAPSQTFDQRSRDSITSAWNKIPKGRRSHVNDPALPGRLVANCMFGFWANLLDEGGPITKGGRKKADYDALWLVLRRAFKGGRAEAKTSGAKYRRVWVHSVVKEVNDLRNRVAHHEPVINGYPLSGQNRRRAVRQGHEACLKLARMLDSNLAAWIAANSTVPAILSNRPTSMPVDTTRCLMSPHLVAAGYPDF
ncbi:hypothetical protein ACFTWF_35030 [Rhodococcus sp. NPDC056960]|uniref:hypothetical protein n=1 Tax=Rhodococcus sp. NPDC056960 TaxID=3345982 RepID=UPI00362BFC44